MSQNATGKPGFQTSLLGLLPLLLLGGQAYAQEAPPSPPLPPITAVLVECNGECTDNTLAQVCQIAGDGFVPMVVDCVKAQKIPRGLEQPCGAVTSDNLCFPLPIDAPSNLGAYCAEVSYTDATVWCMKTKQ